MNVVTIPDRTSGFFFITGGERGPSGSGADVPTGTGFRHVTSGAEDPAATTLASLKSSLGLAGTNSGDQTITLTGDITGSGSGAITATLPVVNTNVGIFTNATIQTNGKGQIIAASSGGAPSTVLNPTSIKTAPYTAAAGELVLVDTTAGNVPVQLPTAPADKTQIEVKQIIRGGTNTVSISTGGADVFNRAGGATSATLTLMGAAQLYQYQASGGIWIVVADDQPYGSLLANAQTWSGQQTFVAPILGTIASGIATNLTGMPISGLVGAGTGVLTALAVNVGSAGAFVVNGGALGTPASGVATNLTGTAAGMTAGAATVLATPRAINGVNFDGSAAITVTAAAGTLSGGTLAGNVLSSSLTSVGAGTIGTAVLLASDADTSLSANSDGRVATQRAIKAYVDSAVTGLLDFKGSQDASANPNYPAALKGDAYYISVAGKIGGASGKSVDIGDVFVASADNAGGTEGSVGTSWFVLEHNLVGALVSGGALGTPSSGNAANLTGLPISTGLTGAGTGVLTALAVNVGSAGAFVTFNGALGTPSSGTLTSATGLPISTGLTGAGTGVLTALAVNVGSAGAFVTFNGAGGTPSSMTGTNITGIPPAGITGTAAILGANSFTAGQTIAEAVGASALTLNGATQTSSFPVINATQTWNAGGTTFTGKKTNITSTASAAASLVEDWQVGSSSVFSIRKDGALLLGSPVLRPANNYLIVQSGAGTTNYMVLGSRQTATVNLIAGALVGWTSAAADADNTTDTMFGRAAAATFQHGAADAASPVAQTIKFQDVVAGTSNTAGVSATIQAPAGTGTGAGGSLIFQVAAAGTTGSSKNAQVTVATINANLQLLLAAGAGTDALPHLALGGANNGIYGNGAGLFFVNGGSRKLDIRTNAVLMNGAALAFDAGTSLGDLFITRPAAATLQQGAANAASPVAQILQAQGSRAGTDSNVGGANYTHASGQGTGTGTVSSFIIQTPAVVASGSGGQTMTEIIRFNTTTGVTVKSGTALQLGNAAVTGLAAGVLAATTNATIVLTDSAGQVYRIPCII